MSNDITDLEKLEDIILSDGVLAIGISWHEAQMAAARQALTAKQRAAHDYAARVRARNPLMQVKKVSESACN